MEIACALLFILFLTTACGESCKENQNRSDE